MPVGTQGTVQGTLYRSSEADRGSDDTRQYLPLALRPGSERIARLGGLHKFMMWDGPILTDSGGFQIFLVG